MLRTTYNERLHKAIINSFTSKSSGESGKIFESCIRGSNGKYDILNARQNRCDCIIKLNGKEYRTEIKSGCGELKVLDFDGSIISDILTNEMVIYTMEFDVESLFTEHCKEGYWNEDFLDTFNRMLKNDLLKYPVYAIKPETFMNLLDEVGLIREKTSTAMAKRPPQEQFYDRITIQSFKNSKRKMSAFAEALETYGMKVTEFK